jgi:xylulokinase
MKTMFGLLPDKFKSKYHFYGINKVIVDINTVLKPALTVIDGFVGIGGSGLSEGKPVQMDLILAGKDPVATDSTACRIMSIDPYGILDLEATNVKPGSEGLIFLPYLMGIGMNPNVRGLFFGLSLIHSKAHLLRSVLEGIAFEFRRMIDKIEMAGYEIRDVRLIGGGGKSKLWCEIIADVTGREISVPSSSTLAEATAFGTALIAGVGVGAFKDFATAKKLIKIASVYAPNKQNHNIYKSPYEIYTKLYSNVKDMYE